MRFRDQLGFISQHMKRNKLRVVMTTLAATMGCAFLIVLASVGFGLHKTFMDELMSNRLITEIELYGKEDSEEPISEAEQQAMKTLPGVKAVVARSGLNAAAEVQFEGRTNFPMVTLTEFEEEKKTNLELSEGTMPASPDEVIVGYHFAQNLLTEEEQTAAEEGEVQKGFEGSLIGREVTLELTSNDPDNPEKKTWSFTVAGIKEKPAKDWIVDDALMVDGSHRSEFHAFANPGEADIPPSFGVYVYADQLESVQTLTQTLKEQGYYVYSITEEIETLNLFTTALKAGLIFVGTIAVLIASIGIFNTMTMAVTERTREIGVMKAIGAKPGLIQRLFLMESAWIGLTGTVLAVIISYGISALSNWLIPMILVGILAPEQSEELNIVISAIPWELVVIASVISLSVAALSGWRPARKATQIDVIQALRQE